MTSCTVAIRRTHEPAAMPVSGRERNDPLPPRVRPRHRFALRTLPERLALWSVWPPSVAISADAVDPWWFEADVFATVPDDSGADLIAVSFLLLRRDRDPDGLSADDFASVRPRVPGA